jgi:predicted Zn-dependent peptidase
MVLAAAGAIEHEALVRHAEAQFGSLNPGSRPDPVAAAYRGGAGFHDGPFEQTHVALGLPAPSYLDPEFISTQILAGILGGGASSRLFQEAREKRGLCYSIYAFASGFADAGLLGFHASTGPEEVAELREIIVTELVDIAGKGPAESELRRVKAQLKAGLLMALESSGARADQIARQMIAYGRPIGLAEMTDRIEAVTVTGVRERAQASLAGTRPTWVEVGPGAGHGGTDIAEIIHRLGKVAA